MICKIIQHKRFRFMPAVKIEKDETIMRIDYFKEINHAIKLYSIHRHGRLENWKSQTLKL